MKKKSCFPTVSKLTINNDILFSSFGNNIENNNLNIQSNETKFHNDYNKSSGSRLKLDFTLKNREIKILKIKSNQKDKEIKKVLNKFQNIIKKQSSSAIRGRNVKLKKNLSQENFNNFFESHYYLRNKLHCKDSQDHQKLSSSFNNKTLSNHTLLPSFKELININEVQEYNIKYKDNENKHLQKKTLSQPNVLRNQFNNDYKSNEMSNPKTFESTFTSNDQELKQIKTLNNELLVENVEYKKVNNSLQKKYNYIKTQYDNLQKEHNDMKTKLIHDIRNKEIQSRNNLQKINDCTLILQDNVSKQKENKIIDDYKSKIHHLNCEIYNHKDMIYQLQDQLQKIQNENSKLKKSLMKLRKCANEMCNEIKVDKNTIDQLNCQINDLNSVYNNIIKDYINIQTLLEQAEKQNKQYEHTLKQKDIQIETIINQIQTMYTENESKNIEISELNSKVCLLETQINELQIQNQEKEQQILLNFNVLNEKHELNHVNSVENEQLKQELIKLKQINLEYEEVINKIGKENKELKLENEELHKKERLKNELNINMNEKIETFFNNVTSNIKEFEAEKDKPDLQNEILTNKFEEIKANKKVVNHFSLQLNSVKNEYNVKDFKQEDKSSKCQKSEISDKKTENGVINDDDSKSVNNKEDYNSSSGNTLGNENNISNPSNSLSKKQFDVSSQHCSSNNNNFDKSSLTNNKLKLNKTTEQENNYSLESEDLVLSNQVQNLSKNKSKNESSNILSQTSPNIVHNSKSEISNLMQSTPLNKFNSQSDGSVKENSINSSHILNNSYLQYTKLNNNKQVLNENELEEMVF